MFTKSKDEPWAAGLFGSGDCITTHCIGLRKGGILFFFFLKSNLSDLIEHPFISHQTLEWMQWPFPQEEGGALSQTVKNASSEYAVSAWMPWWSTFLVDPTAIQCKHTGKAHWEPVLVAAEIYCVLLYLWSGFDVAPLWALYTNHATDFCRKG